MHKAPNCTKNQKCVVCGEAHSYKKEKKRSKCANSRGPHVANYRGCPAYKDQAFRQHVVQKQVSYASILKKSFSNVVIQIAQPQLCTKNLPEKQVQALKASMVLKKAVPPLAASSNSTKSTKTPGLGSQRKSSSNLSPQQNKTSSTKPSPNKPSN